MNTLYALYYSLDSQLLWQLIVANALMCTGYFMWCVFGARTSLGDWDNPSLKYVPLWLIGINVALVAVLN